MTSLSLANPRRTSLSSLATGSELATCQSGGCHNIAVTVLATASGRSNVCRSHATS